ncbi:hypothetical protein M3Y94_01154000 [Aphelenchoides besseyi]|nr:hypothetical protein M3Y94_01154000 [Aphelenchoides besseyi]KAI6227994.1 hypothetical protein M3Y95_00575600 [Aphelenchoides besseyi]
MLVVKSLQRSSFAFIRQSTLTMKNANRQNKNTQTQRAVPASTSAVSVNKNGQIVLRIHATPGAKRSAITSMDDEAIHVSLAAPPRDGQANQELVDCIGEFLSLRKAELDFDKGARSRTKVLLITTDRYSETDIRNKIELLIKL